MQFSVLTPPIPLPQQVSLSTFLISAVTPGHILTSKDLELAD